jgi:hypothetical protein
VTTLFSGAPSYLNEEKQTDLLQTHID